jgi:hypothetical protein
MRRQPRGSRPTRRGKTHDTENPANQVAAGGPLPPGADRRHERQRQPVFVLQVRSDGGRSNITSSANPRRVGAGLVPAPIRAGRKPRHTNHLRERRTRGSKPARHGLFARFFAGNLHLHGAELRGRYRSGCDRSARCRTQTYLEVQSLRSWAGAGGDNFQRDTLYVRAISAYWAEKYFPTLTYLGPR